MLFGFCVSGLGLVNLFKLTIYYWRLIPTYKHQLNEVLRPYGTDESTKTGVKYRGQPSLLYIADDNVILLVILVQSGVYSILFSILHILHILLFIIIKFYIILLLCLVQNYFFYFIPGVNGFAGVWCYLHPGN
jgi:hypothetical protein